ncbi:MAG: FHA domain-containing protein [Chloroflexota bacterium]
MNAGSGGDWAYLALRIAFIGAVYWFIAMVARTALRELRALAAADRGAGLAENHAPGNRVLLLDGGESGIPAGAEWELLPGMTVGRRPGNGIEMDDPFLSGIHAEFVHEGGEWWLGDLGSTNGTLLNGSPVSALTAVRDGDIVEFGNVRLQVLTGSGQRTREPR